LTESLEADAIRVREAIAAAQLGFREKYEHLDEGVRDGVLRAVVAGYALDSYEEQLEKCPACGTLALVTGSIDVDWEPDWERGDFGEPYVAGVYPVVSFFPAHLVCRACELELEGQSELEAAGMEESWTLEDVDPQDFVEEWTSDDLP
jgi:hypothetical protein